MPLYEKQNDFKLSLERKLQFLCSANTKNYFDQRFLTFVLYPLHLPEPQYSTFTILSYHTFLPPQNSSSFPFVPTPPPSSCLAFDSSPSNGGK